MEESCCNIKMPTRKPTLETIQDNFHSWKYYLEITPRAAKLSAKDSLPGQGIISSSGPSVYHL